MHIGSIILLIWFFRGFYQEKDKTYTTLRALLSYGIFLVLYVGISIIGVIIGIIYLISTGADLQQFAQ
jgi:formate-dependent nitrite reductase membrane component NrfD